MRHGFHLPSHACKLDSRSAFLSRNSLLKKHPPSDLELITAQPDRSPTQHHHLGKNPRKYGRAAADSSSSSLSPTNSPSAMNAEDKNKVDDDSQSSSEDEGRPPERAKPQSQTFGDDPATFPDPTVYEIRDVAPDMTDEQRKEIYSVAVFPRSDLADMVAGDPPEKDFSNTKPTNQISFATFSSYVEPFFRPFNDEDLAFLRERSDRLLIFQMPKRGKKHYTDIWAQEDGAMSNDSSSRHDRFPPNQPRGSIDALDDDVAETDKLSLPPLVSRLLCAMRPENRCAPADDNAAGSGVNGETVYGGGDLDTAMADPPPPLPIPTDVVTTNLPAATHIPEFNMEAFKKGTSARLEHHAVDERLKQELQHVGFLGMDSSDEVDYDAQQDDEVCARLRHLQERLRKQILVNGARKARLTELVKERMAFQEYTTIHEDLDLQVQSAYLKRTRTIGKSKKKSRLGTSGSAAAVAGSGGAGMQSTARPGIGDMTRMLMERRKRWIDNIGPVFDGEMLTKVPRSSDPDSSVFKEELVREYIARERQAWDDEEEAEEE